MRVGSPSTARDDTSTTRPNPAAFIAGRHACSSTTAAERCRLTSAFRSSSLTSGSRAGRIVPALWISVVTWCAFAISRAACSVAFVSVRSTAMCFTCLLGPGFRSSEMTSWLVFEQLLHNRQPDPRATTRYEDGHKKSWIEGRAASAFRMSTRLSLIFNP